MAFWNFLNKFFFYRRNSDTMATEPFSVYDTHKPGLCIIIANFIDGKSSKSNLDGYVDDINGIKEVFQNKKRFDFEVLDKCEDDKGKTIPFRNLSKDQFEEVLGLIQKKLNKEGKKYGKFVMFVLSHGSEKGIMMYPQDSEEEYQYITDEEIIDHFSHDYVPSLRGVPKCFFFQACRGPEETRASNKDMEMEESEKHIQNHLPIITRANILVAHATLDQKRAYVNHCGSFFLEELIHQLKNEDLNCDIFSLLTKVIDLVSQKEKSQAFTWDSEGIIIEVKGKDGFTPTTLIGKASGKNSVFPLEPSSNQKSYDVCAKPDDYKFSGDIKIIQQGFEMNCTVGDQGVSAGKLDIFANDAFEAEGKLTSKLNPSHSQTGKIKVKDGNILVDGEKPTHGVNVKEMDIMVYETDRQGKLIKEMCRVEELQEKKTRVVIHGYLQGDCSIIKRDGIWKASVKIYQLPVFCSTLTKHLYLTKSVPTKREAIGSQNTGEDYATKVEFDKLQSDFKELQSMLFAIKDTQKHSKGPVGGYLETRQEDDNQITRSVTEHGDHESTPGTSDYKNGDQATSDQASRSLSFDVSETEPIPSGLKKKAN